MTRRAKYSFQFVAKLPGAVGEASNVIADVSHDARSGHQGKHSVKGCNPMYLRRRHAKPQGNVIGGTGTDPANVLPKRMQHGQQTVSFPEAVVGDGRLDSCETTIGNA